MKMTLDEAFKKSAEEDDEEFKKLSNKEFKKNVIDVLEVYPNGFWRKMVFTKPNGDKINVTNSIPPKNK